MMLNNCIINIAIMAELIMFRPINDYFIYLKYYSSTEEPWHIYINNIVVVWSLMIYSENLRP